MKLKDRVVLLTGAGTLKMAHTAADQFGNGTACAVAFAREGALVVCADRSLEAAQEAAALVHRAGGRAEAVQMDVSRTDSVNRAVEETIRTHGRLDVLHNNVGIEILGDLLEVSDSEWDQVMAVNLRGAMAVARAAVPQMIAQGGGAIINVSSTASLKWSPMQFLSYSTSKAGLNHMTRVIARQYAAQQVRCNCIIPGMIRTPHADALYKNAQEAREGHEARDRRCPMGRQGSPWDIANAAVFLASDDASYITGAQLVVDGGASL